MRSLLVILLVLVCGCYGQLQIRASGATSTANIFNSFSEIYSSTQNPDVVVTYDGESSGFGRRELLDGITVFGGSDTPFSDEEYLENPDLLLLPLISFGVVPYTSSYTALVLTVENIADIYMGKITNWNDPAIANLNPDISFPNAEITKIYREGSSGTTTVFTSALAHFNEEWDERFGIFSEFPEELTSRDDFIPASGNSGTFVLSNLTPNSIAYFTYSFSLTHDSTDFNVRIASSNESDAATIICNSGTINLATVGSVFDERGFSDLTEPADPNAWPISSYSYLIFRGASTDTDRCDELREAIRYVFYGLSSNTGSVLLEQNGFGFVSREASGLLNFGLLSITCGGEPAIDPTSIFLPVEPATIPFYYSSQYSTYSPISTATYSPFFDSVGSPVPASEADSYVLSSLSRLDETMEYFYERFYGDFSVSGSESMLIPFVLVSFAAVFMF